MLGGVRRPASGALTPCLWSDHEDANQFPANSKPPGQLGGRFPTPPATFQPSLDPTRQETEHHGKLKKMLPLTFDTYAAKSKAHLLICRALDIAEQSEMTPEIASRTALAELLSHFGDHADFSVGEVLATSVFVDRHRWDAHACDDAVVFDYNSLAEARAITKQHAILACRLAGAWWHGTRLADGPKAKQKMTFLEGAS